MQEQKIELRDHLQAARVLDLDATDKDAILAALVDAAASSDAVADRDALLSAVRERENLLSTGIGLGIAIPHARIESVHDFVVAVGRHAAGLDFGSIDGRPVHIVVLIAGPQDAKKPYLELLDRCGSEWPDLRQDIVSGSLEALLADALLLLSLLPLPALPGSAGRSGGLPLPLDLPESELGVKGQLDGWRGLLEE